MNTSKFSNTLAAALLLGLGVFTGCESTDGGSTHVSNNYYGVGYQDPWYHGDYDDDDVIIVPPPSGERPDNGLRPTHPIASPPSIPSRPRPAPRGGGRR